MAAVLLGIGVMLTIAVYGGKVLASQQEPLDAVNKLDIEICGVGKNVT